MGAGQTPIVGGVGGSGQSYRELIEYRVLPGNSPRITFASLPQTYRNIVIEAWLVTSTAVAVETLLQEINGSANSAEYYIQDFGAISGATVVGHAGTNRACAQSVGNAGLPAFNEIRLLDYAITTNGNKLLENRYLWSETNTKIGQIHRFMRHNGSVPITDFDLVGTGDMSGRVWLYGEGAV